MATTTEQLRKALEDMMFANLVIIYLIKHGTLVITPGENNIVFEGDPYDTNEDYGVAIFEALDSDGISIKGELEIINYTVNGFTISWQPFGGATSANVKWSTARFSPKINFWT